MGRFFFGRGADPLDPASMAGPPLIARRGERLRAENASALLTPTRSDHKRIEALIVLAVGGIRRCWSPCPVLHLLCRAFMRMRRDRPALDVHARHLLGDIPIARGNARRSEAIDGS